MRRSHQAPPISPLVLRFFPVETASSRGAAQFLRTAEAVLRAGGVLWLTPQGRFADPRELPLAFKPGLGALVARMPEVSVLPLAVEYTFWDERLPETLLHFGPCVAVGSGATTEEATAALEAALGGAMHALQGAAIARDASAFTPLFSGARGTGGAYGIIRRLKGLFRAHGDTDPDHTRRDAGKDLLHHS